MFDTHQTEREWADCSGAALGVLVAKGLADLEQLPDTVAGDAEAFDLARAAMRVEAWAVAARAKAVAQVYARTLTEHQKSGQARASHRYDDAALTRSEVAANLSLELAISLPAADQEVRLALGLAQHPVVAIALATGRIHAPQARALVSELGGIRHAWVQARIVRALLSDPQSPASEHVLVRELRRSGAQVWDLPVTKIKAIVRREAAELDPEYVTHRTQEAQDRRHVRYYGGPDNAAELVLRGAADQLAAVIAHLDSTAGQALRSGHLGTLDQIRFDVAVGWLTEGACGLHVVRPDHHAGGHSPGRPARQVALPTRSPAALINVTTPGATLAGGNQPGVLHGPDGDTPLPAELVRELAYDPGNAIWRQVVCDPVTGQARSISQNYRPSKALADFVMCRDGYTSRFPTSNARRRIELDHVVEFDHTCPAAGGPTSPANLAAEGLREHRLKTDQGFFISGNADGCLTYRTRSGRTYDSWPAQHMKPIAGLGLNAPLERPPTPTPSEPPPDYGADPPF
jgi:hypothetical protein